MTKVKLCFDASSGFYIENEEIGIFEWFTSRTSLNLLAIDLIPVGFTEGFINLDSEPFENSLVMRLTEIIPADYASPLKCCYEYNLTKLLFCYGGITKVMACDPPEFIYFKFVDNENN